MVKSEHQDEPNKANVNVKEQKLNSQLQKQEPLTTTNSTKNIYVLSGILGIISILTVLFIAAEECRQCFNALDDTPTPDAKECQKTFWTYGLSSDTSHLKEVFTVLGRLGYKNDANETDWDLLWAHDYPFRTLYEKLSNLRPHQKVNHFPGCGHITNKVNLATSGLKYIPPAFKLPQDKSKLLEYATRNPSKSFIQKDNDHRKIKVRNIADIDLDTEGTFVQEYIDKPLLIDGYKFDIGIYTIITSVEPLRVYIYNGEALLRFCPFQYYPFDPEVLDKYIVGDDYLPIWEIPALDHYYNVLKFNMKESLNAYLRSKDQNPNVIWEQIEDSIRTVVLAKEELIVNAVKRFRSKRNFFEMMRFDFVIDENLKIYLLEGNMSPNLSSAHFPPNSLLYQQVLYNLFGLIGIGERIVKNSLAYRSRSELEMLVSDKSLAVFPEKCTSSLCRTSCISSECHLCKICLSDDTRDFLTQAYFEHINKGECKRIFPPPMTKEKILEDINIDDYTPENQLQYKWFQGKCLQDPSWC